MPNTTNISTVKRELSTPGIRVRLGIGAAIAVLGIGIAVISFRPAASLPILAALPEVERPKLVLNQNRLKLDGQVFTGWMLEHYPDGLLKSRSAISNGVLHGISEGWFTNQTLQVSEHFVNGVSHGERLQWDEMGRPVSAAQVVNGAIDGVFQRWHKNGTLSEEITMKAGRADGLSRAWYPSGFLKSELTLAHGIVKSQHLYKDGERRDSAGTLAREGAP
jgi:hypothetical protein